MNLSNEQIEKLLNTPITESCFNFKDVNLKESSTENNPIIDYLGVLENLRIIANILYKSGKTDKLETLISMLPMSYKF